MSEIVVDYGANRVTEGVVALVQEGAVVGVLLGVHSSTLQLGSLREMLLELRSALVLREAALGLLWLHHGRSVVEHEVIAALDRQVGAGLASRVRVPA